MMSVSRRWNSDSAVSTDKRRPVFKPLPKTKIFLALSKPVTVSIHVIQTTLTNHIKMFARIGEAPKSQSSIPAILPGAVRPHMTGACTALENPPSFRWSATCKHPQAPEKRWGLQPTTIPLHPDPRFSRYFPIPGLKILE